MSATTQRRKIPVMDDLYAAALLNLGSLGDITAEQARKAAHELHEREGHRWTFVYFMQQGDDGPVKIGVTKDPRARHKTLQAATPHVLHVRALIWRHPDTEKLLHRIYAEHHLRGEWFHPAPAILEFAKFHYEWDLIDEMIFGRDPYPGVDWEADDWEQQMDAVVRERFKDKE